MLNGIVTLPIGWQLQIAEDDIGCMRSGGQIFGLHIIIGLLDVVQHRIFVVESNPGGRRKAFGTPIDLEIRFGSVPSQWRKAKVNSTVDGCGGCFVFEKNICLGLKSCFILCNVMRDVTGSINTN